MEINKDNKKWNINFQIEGLEPNVYSYLKEWQDLINKPEEDYWIQIGNKNYKNLKYVAGFDPVVPDSDCNEISITFKYDEIKNKE